MGALIFDLPQLPQLGPLSQGRASTTAAHRSLTRISMVPLEIFVVMPKAWKKEVFSGPRPVFCAGTVTSQGAIAPARAAAGTWRKGKLEAGGMLTSQRWGDGGGMATPS